MAEELASFPNAKKKDIESFARYIFKFSTIGKLTRLVLIKGLTDKILVAKRANNSFKSPHIRS